MSDHTDISCSYAKVTEKHCIPIFSKESKTARTRRQEKSNEGARLSEAPESTSLMEKRHTLASPMP